MTELFLIRCPDITACWFFQCSCVRCLDPSELGTNLSAALCQDCEGPVLPPQWTCTKCGLARQSEALSLVQINPDTLLSLVDT